MSRAERKPRKVEAIRDKVPVRLERKNYAR
jgi:hypothetical protein